MAIQKESMSSARVTIVCPDSVETLDVPIGETVLSLLQRSPGLYIDAPCGGNGTCGKCALHVEGRVSPPDPAEAKRLGSKGVGDGFRLACQVRIEGDCRILLAAGSDELQQEGASRDELAFDLDDPVVRITPFMLEAPNIEDQRDSVLRFSEATGIPESKIPLSVRDLLGTLAYREPYRAIYSDRTLIDIVPDAHPPTFGIAADIGTSTVVLSLVDLASGKLLVSRSELNAQKSYGADVISRISHASQGGEFLERLQRRIVDQVQAMTERMVEEVGGTLEEVVLLVAAGNTTMLHLLAGISPEKIAIAPFVPVFTDSLVVDAAEIGLRLHPRAEVRFLPSVAAYVGADIVAGIVATSIDRSEQTCLLVDLGTNCEMVLGGRRRILACATAAGPAFEGAQIECGVGGVPGAIRRVWGNEEPQFETIGDLPPVGICGSGILDTVALLLSTGLVDETGRMSASSLNVSGDGFRARMSESGGKNDRTTGDTRFLLTPPHEGFSGAQKRLEKDSPQEIFFTQKDLREVQLAKAAVAAGIEVLVERMGIEVDEIASVYLAGSFGSALSADAACRIGLLPEVLRHRIIAVGNSSGRGALLALRSLADSARCEEVRHRVEYIELSSDASFRDAFIEEMAFPAELPGGGAQTSAGGRD